MKSNTQTITLGILLSIVFIILVLIVIFRDYFFGYSRDSADKLASRGFGTFTSQTQTPCRSETGFCSDPGQMYITQTCIPNPTTGFGCVYNGKQVYSMIAQKAQCIPQCVTDVWQPTTGTPIPPTCVPDASTTVAPFGSYGSGVCININSIGEQQADLTCTLHDFVPVGINLCKLVVPAGTSNFASVYTISGGTCSTISGANPDDKAGIESTCVRSTRARYEKPCVPVGYKTCGVLGVPIYDVSSSVVGTKICTTQLDFGQTDHCYKISSSTSQLMSTFDDIFDVGWTSSFDPSKNRIPLSCVSKIDGASAVTDNIICEPPPGCITNPTQLPAVIATFVPDSQTKYGQGIYGCMDNIYECIQPCLYYNINTIYGANNVGTWVRNLAAYPFFIKSATANRYVILNKTPCNTDGSKSLAAGILPNIFPFTDCFGNPFEPMNDVTLKMYNPGDVKSNYLSYGIQGFPSGGGFAIDEESVKISNNMIFFFRPNPVPSASSTFVEGNLFGFQSVQYHGYINMSGTPRWIPFDQSTLIKSGGITQNVRITITGGAGSATDLSGCTFSISPAGIGTPTAIDGVSSFTIESLPQTFDIHASNGVTYPGIGPYSTGNPIVQIASGPTPPSRPNATYYPASETTPNMNLVRGFAPGSPFGTGTDGFAGFHNLMTYRYTRSNPYTCNIQYSYPPPDDYITADIPDYYVYG